MLAIYEDAAVGVFFGQGNAAWPDSAVGSLNAEGGPSQMQRRRGSVLLSGETRWPVCRTRERLQKWRPSQTRLPGEVWLWELEDGEESESTAMAVDAGSPAHKQLASQLPEPLSSCPPLVPFLLFAALAGWITSPGTDQIASLDPFHKQYARLLNWPASLSHKAKCGMEAIFDLAPNSPFFVNSLVFVNSPVLVNSPFLVNSILLRPSQSDRPNPFWASKGEAGSGALAARSRVSHLVRCWHAFTHTVISTLFTTSFKSLQFNILFSNPSSRRPSPRPYLWRHQLQGLRLLLQQCGSPDLLQQRQQPCFRRLIRQVQLQYP